MTDTEFIEWKLHPVTKEVFSLLQARVEDMKESIIQSAGSLPIEDARKSGYILACYDLLRIEYGDTQQ